MAQDVKTATADSAGEATVQWRPVAGYDWHVSGVAVSATTSAATPPVAVLERDGDYITSTVQGVSDTAQGGPYGVPNGSVLSVTWAGLNPGDQVKAICIYQPARPSNDNRLLQGALRFSQPAASVATIGGTVEVIGSTKAANLLASGNYVLAGTGLVMTATIDVSNLQENYEALLIRFDNTNTAPIFAAQATTGTFLFSSGVPVPAGSYPNQVIVPFANAVGDDLTLTLYSFAPAGQSSAFYLYGMAACPIPVRPDGRAYPVGSFCMPYTTPSTDLSAYQVAVPGMRCLLKALCGFVVNTAGAGTAWGSYTHDGFSGHFGAVACYNGAGSVNYEVESGVLADPNTPLGVQVGFAPAQLNLAMLFDLVPE